MKNIVLIGMPGAGKSTIGELLSKILQMPFIDTDILIRERQNDILQNIIDGKGINEFLKIEESVVLSLDVENHIIATGGSVIYSEESIKHLKGNGLLIYLKLEYWKIEKRIKNLTTRGIAMGKEQTLLDLYNERTPLYEKHADITIDCSNKHISQVIEEIKEEAENLPQR
ncbi:MAG: shikimate kinase [Clostridia bacterium]|nr:shikimate kinase [Clostridia bacterium]